jgi:hypothetical protein
VLRNSFHANRDIARCTAGGAPLSLPLLEGNLVKGDNRRASGSPGTRRDSTLSRILGKNVTQIYAELGRLKIISTLKADLRREIAGVHSRAPYYGLRSWNYYYAPIYQVMLFGSLMNGKL